MNQKAFERVILEARELQKLLPQLEMVAVGGAAAAIHCGHRFSSDVDCVTPLLSGKFHEIAKALERWEGWKTNRLREPVLILGERHDVELGIRQLRRAVPLQSTTANSLKVPTPGEVLRIKAFLSSERRATRDFLDVAALIDLLGEERSLAALRYLNLVYEQKTAQTPVTRFAESCELDSVDVHMLDLKEYKGIKPPFDEWTYVQETCRRVSRLLLKDELDGALPQRLDEGFFETHGP